MWRKNRVMKLCLAGTCAISNKNQEIVKDSKYVLESFYYIKDWQVKNIHNFDLFLLDSGAFTFMSNASKKINWKEYIDKYIDFIKENNIQYFFELDIDKVIGYDKVKKYTKYIEKNVGRKCIPVWHRTRGLAEWKRLTREYDYVAIGGFAIKDIKRTEYKFIKELLKIAEENKCKVHGLGFTGLEEIKKYHFYSVDSTSWRSGNRFGILYVFKNNRLKQIPRVEGKRLKSGKFYTKVEYWNFYQWIKFQNFADKYL